MTRPPTSPASSTVPIGALLPYVFITFGIVIPAQSETRACGCWITSDAALHIIEELND
jgi:hypothetical protein